MVAVTVDPRVGRIGKAAVVGAVSACGIIVPSHMRAAGGVVASGAREVRAGSAGVCAGCTTVVLVAVDPGVKSVGDTGVVRAVSSGRVIVAGYVRAASSAVAGRAWEMRTRSASVGAGVSMAVVAVAVNTRVGL